MKIYMGTPAPGGQPAIFVTEGPSTKPLELIPPAKQFGWGKSLDRIATAHAILTDHLDGDDYKARLYATRFTWRLVANWPQDKPFTITTAEVEAVLAAIRETEQDTAAQRQLVDKEAPPVASDNPGGINGGNWRLSKDGVPVSQLPKDEQ